MRLIAAALVEGFAAAAELRLYLEDGVESALLVGAGRWWKTLAVKGAVAGSLVAVGVVVAGLWLCAVAAAHRGDGVFSMATGMSVAYGDDIAMLTDGSVVVLGVETWRLSPDGQRSSIPGLGGTGLAATADGGLLIIRGGYWDHRIERWSPHAGLSVVAGTGSSGFAGDGGPAQYALMNLSPRDVADPTGIVARPDGGFVFVDTGNRRIRAVDVAGVIHTLAGSSSGPFADPMGLAAAPDGSYVVTENLSGRVRRLGLDGQLEMLARVSDANDVVVAADGSIVVSQAWDGQLWRLQSGSRTPVPYLRAARPTDTFDFAARETFGSGLAVDPRGGLLAVGPATAVEDDASTELTYVPNGPTTWALAALRRTRPDRNGVAAVIETTQPGTATLDIVKEGRIVASVTQSVGVGHSRLRAVGPIGEHWYAARLRLDTPGKASAHDEVPIHGARRLTITLTRKLLGRRQGNVDDVIHYRLGDACRRFGPRRVDCEIRSGNACAGIAATTLERTGIVLRRHYRCGRPRFRRHPRFMTRFGPALQRLSQHNGGVWLDG